MAGMVLHNVYQLLIWIGLDNVRNHNGVLGDLLSPNGLLYLTNENSDSMISACFSYTKRVTVQMFSLTRVQVKSLVYCVKDRHRIRENFEYLASADDDKFLAEIDEAIERHDSRTSQKNNW